eukprot:3080040-Pyramimonas_sp.AAC.1
MENSLAFFAQEKAQSGRSSKLEVRHYKDKLAKDMRERGCAPVLAKATAEMAYSLQEHYDKQSSL